MKRYFLILSLLFICICGWGQAKIYTMKVRLEDFPVKTTRIVLSGNEVFDSALKKAVEQCWSISSYDFCSQKEYNKKANDNSLYFLRLTQTDGINSIELSKGGNPKEENMLKRGFSVVSVPVGEEYEYFPAFIIILQNYMIAAMNSDKAAYAGLKYNNAAGKRKLKSYGDSEGENIVNLKIGKGSICFNKESGELYNYHK